MSRNYAFKNDISDLLITIWELEKKVHALAEKVERMNKDGTKADAPRPTKENETLVG